MNRIGFVGAWLAAATLFASCSPGHDARLAAARGYLDQREPTSAILEAKSALQSQPDSTEARIILGRALLAAGDVAGALVELERVQAGGAPPAEIAPYLGAAWLASGQPRKLVDAYDQIALPRSDAGGSMAHELARAHLQLGQRDLALERLEQGLAVAPGNLQLRILKARLRAASGDAGGAWSDAEELLRTHEGDADVWVLRGDLLRVRKQGPDGAAEAYRRALALQPDAVDAQSGLIDLAVEMRDLPAARKQVAAFLKARPGNAQAQLMDASIALMEGKPARARELAQGLLKATPRHPKVLFLSGLAEARLGSLALAETQLALAVAGDPDAVQPRLELGRVLLMQGKAQRVLDLMSSAGGREASSAATLLLVAQAHLMLGDVARADAVFSQASRLAPNDPEVRTARALSSLQRGASETALNELAAVAKTDSQPTADLALVAGLMQAGKLKQAMAAADAMAAKLPAHPMPDHLRGQIASVMKEPADAARFFEGALQKDGAYLPALLGLVRLDVAAGQLDRARGRFTTFVSANPRHVGALLAQAGFLLQRGDHRSAIEVLAAAEKAHPAEPSLRVALIDIHLRRGDTRSALQAAEAAAAAMPHNAEVQERVAAALLAAGRGQQAISAYSQLLAQRTTVRAHLGMARVLETVGRLDEAQTQITSAMRLDPQDPAPRQAAAWLALRRGRLPEALELAKQLQKLRPNDAVGHRLEAEVALARGQLGPATASLRTAITKAEPGDTPGVLYKTLKRSGKQGEASRFASTWSDQHREDLPFRLYIADQALMDGDREAAEKAYRAVLQEQPENVWALTNLAGMLLKERPQDALALAERAAKAAPFRADVKAVFASALAEHERLDAAVRVQLDAVSLAPDAPALRVALARLYLLAGDKPKARDQLEQLRGRPASPALRAEVNALLEQSSR